MNSLCSDGVQYREVPGMFDLDERTFFCGATEEAAVFFTVFFAGSGAADLSAAKVERSRLATTSDAATGEGVLAPSAGSLSWC
jgi:hypothetical protein